MAPAKAAKAAKAPGASKNVELARGIGQGRSKSYHRRGVWAVKKKNGGKLPVHPKKAAAPAKADKVRGAMDALGRGHGARLGAGGSPGAAGGRRDAGGLPGDRTPPPLPACARPVAPVRPPPRPARPLFRDRRVAGHPAGVAGGRLGDRVGVRVWGVRGGLRA